VLPPGKAAFCCTSIPPEEALTWRYGPRKKKFLISVLFLAGN
jgi:hypothetical protein